MIWYSPELNLILHCKVRLGNQENGNLGVQYEFCANDDAIRWNEEVMMSSSWYFIGIL